PHAPRSGRVERAPLERHITDEAPPPIAGAANQVEHAIEEPPDLDGGSPRVLERLEHRVHNGLGIALQAREQQVPFAAERGVQAVPAGAGAAHQPVERRRGVPLPPKQLHGAVESLCGLECLGPRHASPPFKNVYSDITMPSRTPGVNRSRGAPGAIAASATSPNKEVLDGSRLGEACVYMKPVRHYGASRCVSRCGC